MIRRFKEDDILKIVELENSTLNTSLGFDMLKSSLDNEMAYFFVLEENEKILGYISTMFDGEIVEILNFAVDKSYQHKGLGSKILAYIDNYFYSLNAKSMILEVRNNNISAIKIYEKFGFKQIHIRKNYYSNGDDALILEHKLISCEDIYDDYVLVDAKKEKYSDYIKFFDDVQQDKYYTNYFKIINPSKDLINDLKQKQFRPFFMIWTSEEIDDLLDYKFEKDSLVYMHSSIFGIKSLKSNDLKIVKLDKSNSNELYDFEYKGCLEFGKDFAKGNAKRAKFNLENGKLDYFAYYDNGKIVAHLFTHRIADAILIEDVYVLEEERHKGICSALFNYAIKYHKENGVKEVVLIADSNDTPEAMYEQMGFMVCGKAFTYRMD